MKKHPFLIGIFLLIILGFSTFLLVFSVSYYAGDKGIFHLRDRVAVVAVRGIITDSKNTVDQINKFAEDGEHKGTCP